MNRLDEAVMFLHEKKASCVILIDGKLPHISDGIGIKPLMEQLRKDKTAFSGGVIADKVVGKAAALMAVLGGATAVYGEIMSEDAKLILERYHLEYKYHELVPYIENRTKTGRCPMEETVITTDDPKQAFDMLEETIARLMRMNKD